MQKTLNVKSLMTGTVEIWESPIIKDSRSVHIDMQHNVGLMMRLYGCDHGNHWFVSNKPQLSHVELPTAVQ